MGASSVTGVSGAGSAEPMGGSERMGLNINKLIGPKIVYAGSVSTGSGTATFDFPTLSGSNSDYIGIACDTNSTVDAVNVTSVTTSSITVKGTASHTINFCIIKTTLAQG